MLILLNLILYISYDVGIFVRSLVYVMLARHKQILISHKLTNNGLASNKITVHRSASIKSLAIDKKVFESLIGNNLLLFKKFNEYVQNSDFGCFCKPISQEYYKILAHEEFRKYRGIAQLIFRYFNFDRTPSDASFAHIFAFVNHNDPYAGNALHTYRKFLHQYYHSDEKKRAFEKTIPVIAECEKVLWNKENKFIREKLYDRYIQTKNYYYFYNKFGQFKATLKKRISCYIHGLTPSDLEWSNICYHLFCIKCKTFINWCKYRNISYPVHIQDKLNDYRIVRASDAMCKECYIEPLYIRKSYWTAILNECDRYIEHSKYEGPVDANYM